MFPRMRFVLPFTVAALTLLVGTPALGAIVVTPGHPATSLIGSAVSGPAQAAMNSSAPTTCFAAGFPDCSSTDPTVTFGSYSVGDTSSCTFKDVIDWGDKTSNTYTYPGGPNGAKLATFTHKYAKDQFKTYAITFTGTTVTGTCNSASATLQFTLLACATNTQPSGPSWVAKFPDSKAISALAPTFRANVADFIAAMKSAKIKVQVITTLRPRERAYLMHWSWLIAKGQAKPENVPAFAPTQRDAPVDICWIHLNSAGIDEATSIAAARQMTAAYRIDLKLKVAPALNSRHTQGLAIDMTTFWTAKKIEIREKNGHLITIGTTPRSGLNWLLIGVGKTYGVIHFLNAAKDANHWSSDGH